MLGGRSFIAFPLQLTRLHTAAPNTPISRCARRLITTTLRLRLVNPVQPVSAKAEIQMWGKPHPQGLWLLRLGGIKDWPRPEDDRFLKRELIAWGKRLQIST